MASGIDKLTPIPTTGIGMPDYSTSAPIGSVSQGGLYTNNDPAELAVRLGVYNSVDRRGNVVLVENFENGVEAWIATLGAGAGSESKWSAESFRSGGFSLKLSGGLGTMSQVQRWWGVNSTGKVGAEFSFASSLFHTLNGANLYNDGINAFFALWSLTGTALYIYDRTAGLVQILADVEMLYNDQAYNGIKLVWDTSNGQYVRIIVNQIQIDLSKYAVPTLPAPLPGKHMVGTFQIVSAAARNDHAYIDDFVATVNEPINT